MQFILRPQAAILNHGWILVCESQLVPTVISANIQILNLSLKLACSKLQRPASKFQLHSARKHFLFCLTLQHMMSQELMCLCHPGIRHQEQAGIPTMLAKFLVVWRIYQRCGQDSANKLQQQFIVTYESGIFLTSCFVGSLNG